MKKKGNLFLYIEKTRSINNFLGVWSFTHQIKIT